MSAAPLANRLSDITAGRRNAAVFRRFSEKRDVTVTEEDVWNLAATKVFPTAAAVVSVVSAAAADTVGGTGARTIKVDYLDANYCEKTETLSLSGATPVTTTGTALRLIRGRVLTVGSGGAAAGNIDLSIGGAVQGRVRLGENNTLMSHYTVPIGKLAVLYSLEYTTGDIGGGSDITVRMESRDSSIADAAWSRIVTEHVHNGSASGVIRLNGIRLPAKSDIRVRAYASAGSVELSVEYELLLYNVAKTGRDVSIECT